jgi:hypothetical protein
MSEPSSVTGGALLSATQPSRSRSCHSSTTSSTLTGPRLDSATLGRAQEPRGPRLGCRVEVVAASRSRPGTPRPRGFAHVRGRASAPEHAAVPRSPERRLEQRTISQARIAAVLRDPPAMNRRHDLGAWPGRIPAHRPTPPACRSTSRPSRMMRSGSANWDATSGSTCVSSISSCVATRTSVSPLPTWSRFRASFASTTPVECPIVVSFTLVIVSLPRRG